MATRQEFVQVFRPSFGAVSTMHAVFARLGLRTLNLAVLFFAALGFCFVPLGERTAWQHTRAILATEAAQRAHIDLKLAWARLGDVLVDVWDSEPTSFPQAHIVPAVSPYAVPMPNPARPEVKQTCSD